jgi:hypothetical protein
LTQILGQPCEFQVPSAAAAGPPPATAFYSGAPWDAREPAVAVVTLRPGRRAAVERVELAGVPRWETVGGPRRD